MRVVFLQHRRKRARLQQRPQKAGGSRILSASRSRTDGQPVARPGNGHVEEPALFLLIHFLTLAHGNRTAQRRRKFKERFAEVQRKRLRLHAQQPHVGEFQPLGSVDGHQLHGVRIPQRRLRHLVFGKQRDRSARVGEQIEIAEKGLQRSVFEIWFLLPVADKAKQRLQRRVAGVKVELLRQVSESGRRPQSLPGNKLTRRAHLGQQALAGGHGGQHRLESSIPSGGGQIGPKLHGADAEAREGAHAKQASGVAFVAHRSGRRQQIADHTGLHHIEPFYDEGNVAGGQLLHDFFAVGVRTVEHRQRDGLVGTRCTFARAVNLLSDTGRLFSIGLADFHRHRFIEDQPTLFLIASVAARLQRHALKADGRSRAHPGIRIDRRKRHLENVAARTLVLVENHARRSGEPPLELFKGRARCAPKTIDRLVGIAHGKDVLLVARQQIGQDDIAGIAILKLVDQNEPRPRAFLRQQAGVGPQQAHRPADLHAEGAQLLLFKHPHGVGIGAGNLLPAGQNLGGAYVVHFLRTAVPGDTRLGGQAGNPGLDLFRLDQLFMAAIEEVAQIGKELAQVGGFDETLQLQLIDPLAQEDINILGGQDVEIALVAGEHRLAISVEGGGVDGGLALQPLLHPLLHLLRGIFREGDGQNLIGPGVALLDQAGNALHQYRSLARARAGQHQHGPGNVRNRLLLPRIGKKYVGQNVVGQGELIELYREEALSNRHSAFSQKQSQSQNQKS